MSSTICAELLNEFICVFVWLTIELHVNSERSAWNIFIEWLTTFLFYLLNHLMPYMSGKHVSANCFCHKKIE